MSDAGQPALGLAPGELEVVARRLGERIAETRPTSWGWATPAVSVAFASGLQVVVQRRPRAEADRMTTAIDAFAAAGLPVPPILLRTPGESDDVICFGNVLGEVAAARLGEPGGDVRARRMGAILLNIRAVSTDGFPRDPAWAGPAALAQAVPRWVAEAGAAPRLSAIAGAATELVCADPWSPVPTHGDFVPVNLLFAGDALAAILDLGDVALRHPLIDPAWWSLVVGHHHPETIRERAAFLGATGLRTPDREVAAIALLRSLQVAASTPLRRRPAACALVAAAARAWARARPRATRPAVRQPAGPRRAARLRDGVPGSASRRGRGRCS
jgi:aminoglycoside phosphotransferase (APT) family kinase protein